MLIDCDTCRAPATACGDCVMSVLLQLEPRPVELDPAEFGALDALATAGLVPPLRLVTRVVGVPSPAESQDVPEPLDESPPGQDEVLYSRVRKTAGRPASPKARRGIA